VIGQLANPSADPAALLGNIFPPGHEDSVITYVKGITSYPKPMPIAPASVTRLQFAASTAWLLGQEPSGRPLSKLKLPVLVAGGELDKLLPVANQRHIAAALPNATLKIYPDAGHAFLFQHPEFAGEIERFLG
jgi:pimeloyl-ACP methyl ester carboxylesterase